LTALAGLLVRLLFLLAGFLLPTAAPLTALAALLILVLWIGHLAPLVARYNGSNRSNVPNPTRVGLSRTLALFFAAGELD
jgi:hypothetical protein